VTLTHTQLSYTYFWLLRRVHTDDKGAVTPIEQLHTLLMVRDAPVKCPSYRGSLMTFPNYPVILFFISTRMLDFRNMTGLN